MLFDDYNPFTNLKFRLLKFITESTYMIFGCCGGDPQENEDLALHRPGEAAQGPTGSFCVARAARADPMKLGDYFFVLRSNTKKIYSATACACCVRIKRSVTNSAARPMPSATTNKVS
jgi:hypothetical protein